MADSEPSTSGASSSDVPSRFHVDFGGKTLRGIYRVDRELAQGGMGSVYVAQDTNLGRRVVVKVPHVRFLGEPGFRSRFRREISQLVRLEHPHVVRILAQGEEDEVPYFVLQYLGGGSLEDRLEDGTQRPEATLSWLGTIAETLDFVHQHGVIHRDVKPGNILFDELGHVFLSDFGVVKALEREEAQNLTEAGTGIGSPFYMAPEQALGRSLSPASDQYALASTLFEALTGNPPFGRGTLLETILKKDREPAPSVRTLAPSVPQACDAAIARALSRDVAARFESCKAFADAYRRGIADAATATSVSATGAAGATAATRRSPRLVAAVAVVAVLAVAAGVGAATQWYGLATPQATSPVEGSNRVLVQLVKTGAEPRRALRLTFAKDAHALTATKTEETLSMRLGDAPPRSMPTSLEQDIEARVAEILPDGAMRLDWVFPTSRPVEKPGEPSSDATKLLKTFADRFGAVVGTSLMTPRGVVLESSFQFKDATMPVNRYTWSLLAGYEEAVMSLAPTLPEEPVGVGAEWDVLRTVRSFSMRYQRTGTYTLVSREGDRIRLRVKEAFSAPSQPLVTGNKDEEAADAQIRSLTGRGEQELVMDLGLPVAVELLSKGSMTFEASGKEKGVEETGQFEKTYSISAKRK